jgi:cyclase
MTVRIIPRLDIKGPNLVKGIHLEGLRVMGKPERFARLYYEEGADELFYMDVVASLYQRNNLLDIVSKTAEEIFIPLTVGGGLRNLDDIRAVLIAGADKVALNTAAINRPDFVREAAHRFGSSTIVISIEAIRKPDGTYEAYTDNGRQPTGLDAVKWATRVVELGAGEILVTSVDREGTGAGFDIELTRRIAETVSIPVVACGGAGTVAHVSEVIAAGRADAVCMASMLHYNVIRRYGSGDDRFSEGNTDYLKKPRSFSKIQDMALPEIKVHLIQQKISCRPPAVLKASV